LSTTREEIFVRHTGTGTLPGTVRCATINAKQANIMVRAGLSEALLIDFGLARGFIPDVTQPNTRGFSGGFYPPEQYIESARLGEYTDVYALAATLYYLLTKTVPTSAPERALKARLKAPK
jgi:serine/threonine protein kinase